MEELNPVEKSEMELAIEALDREPMLENFLGN
jgi:hypothetical protein